VRRSAGLLCLVQAAVFAAVAAWVAPRWTAAAIFAGIAGLAQVGAGALVLAGRARLVRMLGLLSVVAALMLVGSFAQAAVHVALRYGADAARHGQAALGVILLALPWVLAFPLWQVLRWPGRIPGSGAGGLALLCLGLGLGPATARAVLWAWGGPDMPAQPDAQAAVSAAWARWQGSGQPGVVRPGDGSAEVVVTPWEEGEPGESVRGSGDDLNAALSAALERLPEPGRRPALVVDVATVLLGDERLLPAGSHGSLADGGQSPVTAVHSDRVATMSPLPAWRVPVTVVDPGGDSADGHVQSARFDSFLVSGAGVQPLRNGWTRGPALDADAALAAAVAAGDFLVAHQAEDGRYDYVVRGPQGTRGPGYNYPRHAGATWFLARLAARTREPRFADAARRGLAFLDAATVTLDDGRAWVRDPRRKDGKAWMGTTALALLAATALPGAHDNADAWAALLVTSVDADGAVRGEVDEATGAFDPQPLNPYGQGQTTLALAARGRAGDRAAAATALRAGAFLDGAYAPGAAGKLVVLDEHWACLAASALSDLDGRPRGRELCHGYLADAAWRTPTPGSPLAIPAGPGGGLAEAVVAAAFLDPDGPWRERALRFGQHFLDSQYRAADAPLLPAPRALLGGFRDSPWSLDVRMDAVQHIGCALLGVEELLRGQRLDGGRP